MRHDETRRYGFTFLLNACIVLALVSRADAQLTNIVKVTLDCPAPDRIVLIYENDESNRVSLGKDGDAWIGNIPAGKTWIEPNGTVGSVLLNGFRTDAEPSVKGYHKNKVVAWFDLDCTEDATRDVKIETDGSLDGSYVRTMPPSRSNERSRASEIRGTLRGKKTIRDLRFAPYYLDPTRSKPHPSDPFETLRLNLHLQRDRPDTCDLVVNDWKVIKAPGKDAWLRRAEVIELSAAQRNAGNGCQPPQLSPQALDLQEKDLPPEFKRMKLTLTAPAK